ncbi:MAG: mechanosensitive ion channel [Actinomycetota bacterium]|nr:mechanosensitive ion channel [Actinomycetota bacterium]
MVGIFIPTHLVAQSVDDLEKIEEVVDTAGVSGWDVFAGVLVLVLTWPVGVAVGRITKRAIRRIPGVPEYALNLAKRGAQILTSIVGVAISMSLFGVNVGWFTVTVALVLVLAVLMLRPLIENLAGGLLLETRPSFRIGDEIETEGVRGEVTEINARTTVIRTRDWKMVHIPNNDVLSEAITVLTALERRRSTIELEIEYGAEIAETTRLLVKAASGVDGVHADPSPYIRARGFGTGTYILSLRWWHDPDLSSGGRTLDGVVRAVKRVLDEAGIALPSPEVIVRQPDQKPG